MSGTWIDKETRQRIYARDHHKCAYCGCDMSEHPESLSLDHILARTAGGSLTDPKNLVTCCHQCNSSKNDSPLKKWHSDQKRFARAPKAAEHRGCVIRPVLSWGEITKEIKARVSREISAEMGA